MKALISLRVCAGWSGLLLSPKPEYTFSHGAAQLYIVHSAIIRDTSTIMYFIMYTIMYSINKNLNGRRFFYVWSFISEWCLIEYSYERQSTASNKIIKFKLWTKNVKLLLAWHVSEGHSKVLYYRSVWSRGLCQMNRGTHSMSYKTAYASSELRSACASAQSYQSSLSAWRRLWSLATARVPCGLIRLCGCQADLSLRCMEICKAALWYPQTLILFYSVS